MDDKRSLLTDKRSILQVLGCLILNPNLLDSYKFENGDFGFPLYEIIYGIIFNLFNSGIEKIDAYAIDSYCSRYPEQYKLFNTSGGLEYINSCIELAEVENFSYYYLRMKKFACLRHLDEKGLDIRPLYDYAITDPKEQEKESARFDQCSIEDMINKVEDKLVIEVRDKYTSNSRHSEFRAGEGLKELKEQWKQEPDVGIPFWDQPILSTIVRGARFGTISLFSGVTGTGKTRMGYGKMTGLSVPYYYDNEKQDFIFHSGFDNPCLIMQTELMKEENQSLPLAYVSGVDESIIRTGRYVSKKQEAIVDKAIDYIDSSPLYFDVMTDFSISDIINTIKKYKRVYGVNYFFFDYIQLSQSIIMEMAKGSNGMRMREDIVMLLAITKLKNLVNELGVYLYSATQLNDSYHDATNFKDQSVLRSAKSLADRIDVGNIMLVPSETELKTTEKFGSKGLVTVRPNLVNHIYKCRGTKFSKIKLFQKADLSTCRVTDLFCTNTSNVFIDVPVMDIRIGEKANKEMLDQVEKVIEENSIEISNAVADDVYQALNPKSEEEIVEEIKEQVSQQEAQQISDAQKKLAEMGW